MRFLLPLFSVLLPVFVYILPIQPCHAGTVDSNSSLNPVETAAAHSLDTTLSTLASIQELRSDLKKRLRKKKILLKKASSESEKQQLISDINSINQQLTKAREDFDRISTGIDISAFKDKKEVKFDWKEEISSMIRPALAEMKRMTEKVRRKSRLRTEIETYTRLLPEASEAVEKLRTLLTQTDSRLLKEELKKELAEWESREKHIKNQLNIARMQVMEIEREERSLSMSFLDSFKHFIKTRGLYIFSALAVFAGIILLSLIFRRFLELRLPGYRQEHLSFRMRIMDMFIRSFSAILAVMGMFAVLYAAQDWVLLSIAIMFFIGAGWAARFAIPRLWNQGRLMLNIGPVREGERILMDGIPWFVKKINVFSVFENPDLGISLRLPVERLLKMESRPFDPDEPWFPCKKGDWVILADGTRGMVASLSHEMVELVKRGGARKSYLTGDFLSLNPLNLSGEFRIKVPFGISYELQAHSTQLIPQALGEYLTEQISQAGHDKNLKNIKVEFKEAGASSLDLVVIADFYGEMAPLYNRMRRSIQRWCVDAATINNWEIPFPQLTVHKA